MLSSTAYPEADIIVFPYLSLLTSSSWSLLKKANVIILNDIISTDTLLLSCDLLVKLFLSRVYSRVHFSSSYQSTSPPSSSLQRTRKLERLRIVLQKIIRPQSPSRSAVLDEAEGGGGGRDSFVDEKDGNEKAKRTHVIFDCLHLHLFISRSRRLRRFGIRERISSTRLSRLT